MGSSPLVAGYQTGRVRHTYISERESECDLELAGGKMLKSVVKWGGAMGGMDSRVYSSPMGASGGVRTLEVVRNEHKKRRVPDVCGCVHALLRL